MQVYLYAAVVVLSATVVQAAQKRFMLEIQNISCPSFTTHFKHYDCSYKKVAIGKYFLNSKLMYDTKFGKDIDVHVRARVTPWKSKTSYNFLDLRVNLCVITSQLLSNGLAQKVFHELIRSSNMPLDCSFKPNVMYKMDNYLLTDDFIPIYAGFSNVTFSVSLFQDNQPTGDWILYFVVIPRNNKKAKT